LDRASDYGSEGSGFESLRARKKTAKIERFSPFLVFTPRVALSRFDALFAVFVADGDDRRGR
jgi:hypothetical protein